MAMDRDKYEETKRLILSGQAAIGDFSEEQTAINTQILIDNLKSRTIVEPELFFDSGISMDYRDPETGGTLLHVAAAYGVRRIIRLILKQDATNYLMRDFKGRHPSELAYEVARDFVLGRFLMKKEIQQAGNRIIYGPDAGKIVIR